MSSRKNPTRVHSNRKRLSRQDAGDWQFLEFVLDTIEASPAAQKLIDAIATRRRNTRPGYSARTMLRACSLRYLLTERYVVGLIERLRASPRLRELCGLTHRVPSESTFSRFFRFLSRYPVEAEGLRISLVNELHRQLPELGRVVAIDGTDIESYANPNREVASDPDAAWGARTTKGKHMSPGRKKRSKTDDGKPEAKDVELYFGYKMVSICDVTYGIPLLFVVLPANHSESPLLRDLVGLTREKYEWFAPEYVVADRGFDALKNHEYLNDLGIKPIIHIRRSNAEDGLHDGIYSTRGVPTCDGKTKMEYVWTDPVTGRHLYRCGPEGCWLRTRSSGAVRYCDTTEHWEDPRDNLRVISIVARASKEWKEAYRKRTGGERYFSSVKRSRLLDSSLYLSGIKIMPMSGCQK